MTSDFEVLQQWVFDLQCGVIAELSEEYKKKATWVYDNENLYLTFPSIPSNQLDINQGIIRAMSRYGGRMTQDNIIFPKPNPSQTLPVAASIPIEPIVTVSQSLVNQSSDKQQHQQLGSRGEKIMGMTLTKYVEQTSSNFVSVKTCTVNDVFKIMEKPSFEESEFDGKKRVQLIAKVVKEDLNGNIIDMKMAINQSNARILVNAWGADESQWVGKRVYILDKKKYNNGKEGFIFAPKY